METKREIRKIIRQKRRELGEAVWCRNSEEIASSVIAHPWFSSAEDIYTYVDHNREAGTRKIIETALRMDKRVWIPKVTGDTMCFCRIEDLGGLKPGVYGILEPEDCQGVFDLLGEKDREDGGEDNGLMLMPGVAFDEQCHRIGYGGGYYDRYLARHQADGSKLRTMALAFEFQILLKVPYEEYDIRPKIVVTERRMIIHG